MLTVEEFLEDFLAHDYDPIKAHQYYLRTRELKGRDQAADDAPAKREGDRQEPTSPFRRHSNKQTPEQHRAEVSAQVDALKTKLATLKETLAQLVEAAKLRSGIKPEVKTTQKPKSSPNEPSELTRKQRDDAAKRAKEFREKNPDEVLNQEVEALNTKIKAVQDKIQQMREKLKSVFSQPLQRNGTRRTDSVGVGSTLPRRKGNSQNGS